MSKSWGNGQEGREDANYYRRLIYGGDYSAQREEGMFDWSRCRRGRGAAGGAAECAAGAAAECAAECAAEGAASTSLPVSVDQVPPGIGKAVDVDTYDSELTIDDAKYAGNGLTEQRTEAYPKIQKRSFDLWNQFVEMDDHPQYCADSVIPGEICRCHTVVVDSILKVFVHLGSNLPQFRRFQLRLSEYYRNIEPQRERMYRIDYLSILPRMYVAVFCIRQEGEDKRVYRGRVIKPLLNDFVLVFLLDYGSVKIVRVSDIRLLPRIFLQQEIMAIQCSLRIPESYDYDGVKHNMHSLGRLLEQQIWRKKQQEVIKFNHKVTEFKTGRVYWIITSTMIDMLQDSFKTPYTLADVILHKFFKKNEMPEPEPRWINVSGDEDWNLVEESNGMVKYREQEMFFYWREREERHRYEEFTRQQRYKDPSKVENKSAETVPLTQKQLKQQLYFKGDFLETHENKTNHELDEGMADKKWMAKQRQREINKDTSENSDNDSPGSASTDTDDEESKMYYDEITEFEKMSKQEIDKMVAGLMDKRYE